MRPDVTPAQPVLSPAPQPASGGVVYRAPAFDLDAAVRRAAAADGGSGPEENAELAFELARSRWAARRNRQVAQVPFGPRTSEQRLRDNARERDVLAFVRTSSDEQSDRETRGSPSAQLAAAHEEAERLEVTLRPENIIEAFGEAGTRKVNRRQFLLLRARVRTGLVGVVIVPEHHRLGRNVTDAEAFFTECAEFGVLLLVNGQPFDPTVPTDRYVLGMMAQFAQYENDSRTKWLQRARLQRARELRARYPLPTGLVWASPDDREYVNAARAAGLGHYLDRVREHRAFSPTKYGTYYVLPFPQAEVEAAARLRVEWLLEPGGSVAQVFARIEAGYGGWPVRGHVPTPRRKSRYRPGTTYTRKDWEPVTKDRLARYLESPSLYGIYSWYSASLADTRVRPRPRPHGKHGSAQPAARAQTFAPLPGAPELLSLPAVLATDVMATEEDAR